MLSVNAEQQKKYQAKMNQLEQSLKEMRGELHKCYNGRPNNSLVSFLLSLFSQNGAAAEGV